MSSSGKKPYFEPDHFSGGGSPPETFRSGRDFAAWIGLTPKDHSTGGRQRLGGITKAGDSALRSTLAALLERVTAVPEPAETSVPNFDGMTPYEILGFGPTFTRRALDRARSRLARDLHPDRWHKVSPQERGTREEALKRVNAAYDMLRKQAT